MRTKLTLVIFGAILLLTANSPVAFAACPSADLTGDCFVDNKDFAQMGSLWLNGYDSNDLTEMATQWLTGDPNVYDEMVYLPNGWFAMGDHFTEGEQRELPVHAVLVDTFFMGKFEITNSQYCDYLNSAYPAQLKVVSGVVYASSDDPGDYPYCDTTTSASYSRITWNGSSFGVVQDKEDHPMVQVSWYGSVAYCNWRSSQEGYESCYDINDPNWSCDFSKHGYRLPTEAEWEYAARGGENSPFYRYPWGDSIDGSMANYWGSGDPYEAGGYPLTTPVGYYDGSQIPAGSDMANGYGLYDMTGNVHEWCNDWFASDYYDTSPFVNPTGPASGSRRVLRGSSWYQNSCRVAYRSGTYPDGRFRIYDYGFRIVRCADCPEGIPIDIDGDGFDVIADCNDNDPDIYPGAPEIPGDGIDQDCDGNDLAEPSGMVWVSINDPGVSGHEAFDGKMSKYETTNAQYCQFLNAAKASGDVIVDGSIVKGASGFYSGQDYYNLAGVGNNYNGATNGGAARINWTGSSFTVDSGFDNHPVTYVSWYGSTAFASYYGWRLPTEWEWQAVADHTVDDPYIYSCGPSINNSIANYLDSTHPDGTTVVGSFGTYGYGMCDMAGNVWEWTDSIYSGSRRVLRGGGWDTFGGYCTVFYRSTYSPYNTYTNRGFRVCR